MIKLPPISLLPQWRLALRRVAVLTSLLSAPAAVTQAQSAGAPLTVTTLAGQAGVANSTNGTSATARFSKPTGLVLISNGDLIVTDAANNIFRRVTAGGAVTYFSGRPADQEDRPINTGSTDGPAADARFNLGVADGPVGSYSIAVDSVGNIYFADTLNNTVRKLAPDGTASTIAGAAGADGSANGTGTAARFFVPTGVAIDSSGNLYVADSGNNTIRKIAPGGVVSTLAGSPGTFGSTDATGTAARFTNPSTIATDSAGNLYVTDTANHTIRRITPTGVVTTFAGLAGSSGASDGSGALARFNAPLGIAVDSAGNVYVADSGNHAIRRITPARAVSTIAGAAAVSGSADGVGNGARFFEPGAIAVDAAGTVYIADTANHTIRRGVPVSGSGAPSLLIQSQPQRRQVTQGSSAAFKVLATGTPSPTYQWLKNGETISGATSSTFTIGSSQFADAGLYSVAVTSGTITFTSAPAQLQVFPSGTQLPPIAIFAQPTDREVFVGEAVNFSVEVIGATSPTYQWKKNDVNIVGATSANYTIGSAQISDAGVYSVTVTEGANTVSTAGATLTVNAGPVTSAPSITTQPSSQTVSAGGTVSFSVVATGSPAPSFQWRKNSTPLANGPTSGGSSVSGATTNTLTISGATAADAGTYSVTVSNSVSSIDSAGAGLTVDTSQLPVAPTITTQPSAQTITAGAAVVFSVSATGNPAPTFQWRKNGVSLANGPTSAGSTFSGVTTNTLTITNAATADAGSYSVRVSNSASTIDSVGAQLTVNAVVPPPTAPSRLINLSILTPITSAGEDFTMGYVVGGDGTVGSKPVVIRAAGPALTAVLGVPGTLADPRLEVFAGSTKTGENNNWGGSATVSTAMAAVGAFPYPSATSLDAAFVTDITARDNSVKVSAANNGTGLVIAEVYDATPNASFTATTKRLINVSVLKQFGTGFTIGFVIRGPTAKTVLVRAVGPGLSIVGITSGVVPDPQLTLFSGSGAQLGTNNNWGGTATLTAAFNAVGAFVLPAASTDAALLATLLPGDYTVQVSGVGSATGLGLVEVYEVP